MKKNGLMDCHGPGIVKKWGRIMRITIVLIFGLMFTANANSYSEGTKFDIRMTDQTIRDVIAYVEDNSEFVFLYKNEDFNVDKRVSLNFKDATINQILDKVLDGEGVVYDVYERQIIIRKADKVLTYSQQQQQKTISGVVNDQKGLPLPGVSVVVKGTTVGTITNPDGSFNLSVPSSAETLQFSFIGMKMQEVPLDGSVFFMVVMEVETIGLEEVVAIGYGVQKKSDITGTVASLGQERLEMVPNINISQALQGAIPGVMIQTTSAGASPSEIILLRGRNSITASNTPLIVIDGIPYGGNISDVNPNDIKSIEVLKDASAAAIYGSRGSNGVILITTKTGEKGETKLTYDGYYSIQQYSNLVKPMTGNEFYHFKEERFPGQITLTEQAVYDSGEGVDWLDLGLRKGNSQQHNITASGGSDNTTFFIGTGLTNVQGLLKNDDYLRVSTRLNIDTKITNWLTLGTRTQLAYTDESGAPVSMSAMFTRNPLTTPFDADGNITMYPWPEDEGSNPLEPLLYDNTSNSYQVISNNYLVVDFPFIKGLSNRINTGVRYRFRDDAEYRDRSTLSGFNVNGRSDTRNRKYYNYVIENILSYNRQIGKHNIFATGVISFEEDGYSDRRVEASEFPHDFLSYYSIAQAEVVNNSYGFSQTNLLSQMLRLNYVYNDKYLLTLTGRRDGFSGFGSSSKWGIFPSFAVGWNIINEEFFKWDLISNLKVRASYGLNGNQAVGAYESISRLTSNDYIDMGITQAGYKPSVLGQDNLSWESSKTFNFGLDFGLLNNRITGDLNVYKTNTFDLLLDRTISAVHGISSIIQNIGETKNNGVEFSINSRNIISQNNGLKWNTSGNIAYIRNEIVSLYGILDENGEEVNDVANSWFIGEPIRVNYDYKWIGTWQLDEIEEAAKWSSQPGFVKLEDVNGDGILDGNDKQILGQLDPKVMWGMTNTISYKNFQLDIFIHGVHGITKNVYPYLTDLETYSVIRRNTWAKDWWTPDNPTNDYVKNNISAEFMSGIRGYVYEDASFIRIKDISLSYDFSHLVSDFNISKLRLYFSARNLFTISDWRGLDPELDSQTSTPLQKEFVFGINLGF